MKSKFLLLFLPLVSIQAHAGLQRGLQLNLDNTTRQYDLYIPDKSATGARPLVTLYHGHMGHSDVMTGANHKHAPYKVWLQLAARDNFIVAVPNGEKGSNGYRGGNDCRADTTTNPATDDVKFASRLIDAIKQRAPVDRHRIYATGTSNGGNMVIRLAMEVPEEFAAVAAVVASNPLRKKCQESPRPISILFMNGTGDLILPYRGGKVGKESTDRGVAPSAQDTVRDWLQVDQIKAQPTVYSFPDSDRHDDNTVTRYTYQNSLSGPLVVLYQVKGDGHAEPSRKGEISLVA